MAPPLEPLTFEDVTKVYREERKSAGLTAIRHDFYTEVRTFMDQLKRDFEKESATDSYGTKARQLNQHMVKAREKVLQIFDMRAEKVMHMAVLVAAGGKVDHSRLTEEEKGLLEGSLTGIREMRNSLLDMPRPGHMEFTKMSAMPMPPSMDEQPGVKIEQLAPLAVDKTTQPQTVPETKKSNKTPSPTGIQSEMGPVEVATPSEQPAASNSEIVLLRILEDIPPFAGPSGTYNLGKEDVITLPSGIGR
ncbi:MAG: DNA replication complex GINS family protein, partial [Methanomassiliicoccales archaeon]|nr:DNA replication complex GINS family protein [Methanomassiliicoccales archaeon]